MNVLNNFFSQFRFDSARAGSIGIERERFLLSEEGTYAPSSEEFLKILDDGNWTHELSLCQVEDRTRPEQSGLKIKLNLLENDNLGSLAARKLHVSFSEEEAAQENLPLLIYPSPRYREIAASVSSARLSAACRVAGTHIHMGVSNIEEALMLHNALKNHLEVLCELGDHSNGLRLKLYKEMAIRWNPPIYEGAEHFFEIAKQEEFSENPKNCYHLVRISPYGTVECRVFGVTQHVDEIIEWVHTLSLIRKEVISNVE